MEGIPILIIGFFTGLFVGFTIGAKKGYEFHKEVHRKIRPTLKRKMDEVKFWRSKPTSTVRMDQ